MTGPATELRWTEHPDGSLTLRDGPVEVATFAVGTGIDAVDTPKPHVHPIRTPAGAVVTGYAPADHRWHHGLMLAVPRVDEHNLWGGGTYLDPERGYVVLPNQGVIEHLAWDERSTGASARVTERLRWIGSDGSPLLSERRTWTVQATRSPAAHVLDLDTELASLTGADVTLETPAQNGRPDGGYGGLFLRLPEGFVLEAIAGADGADVTVSGGASDVLVVHGSTPVGEPVTLGCGFVDGPTPGARIWLHRFEPFAAIGWAIAYDDALAVPYPGALRLQHRLAVLDGHQEVALVSALLRERRSTA